MMATGYRQSPDRMQRSRGVLSRECGQELTASCEKGIVVGMPDDGIRCRQSSLLEDHDGRGPQVGTTRTA